ncbi:MAG: acyl-CoA thioesterase [bacterium]|nr:acyl-CoA thioesterase [bacterium]
MPEPTLKVIMMPTDTNIWGKVFGGKLLCLIDEAAGIEALKKVENGFVVTKAIKEAVFMAPVEVGDVISLYASITSTGRTSMTIKVDVFADRRGCDKFFAATAEAVYVAVDNTGKPIPICQN